MDNLASVSMFELETSHVGAETVFDGIEGEDRRKREFRSLVGDISEHLEPKDIKNIVWQERLPSSLREKSALDVLEHLYKHGKFSEYEMRPLAQLLKDIHREDLTDKVDAFWDQFGELFPQQNLFQPLALISHYALQACSRDN